MADRRFRLRLRLAARRALDARRGGERICLVAGSQGKGEGRSSLGELLAQGVPRLLVGRETGRVN